MNNNAIIIQATVLHAARVYHHGNKPYRHDTGPLLEMMELYLLYTHLTHFLEEDEDPAWADMSLKDFYLGFN